MTWRYLAPLALSLLLSGCAGLGPDQRPGSDATPANVTDPTQSIPATVALALQGARELAGKGLWTDAMASLDDAADRFPDDAALIAGRESLRERWAEEQRVIEDRILVNDSESLSEKVGLLDKLALAEPGNLILASRRAYWKDSLAGKQEALVACGEVHVSSHPALAHRCVLVASEIPASPAISAQLARIEGQLRETEERVAQRERLAVAQEGEARITRLIEQARSAFQRREYRRALDTLSMAAQLQPSNTAVLKLRAKVERKIRPQVEALVKRGDQLYLDERLDPAVAAWRAALNLRPGDEEILARIERAKNVLLKLDELRREQNKSSAEIP